MQQQLAESYRHCERIARRSHSNFYLAFLLLPKPRRQAMAAVYAFLRRADDLGDDAGFSDRAGLIEALRDELRQSVRGTAGHRPLVALADTIRTYDIPPQLFEDVLDGIAMDLTTTRYATFADLAAYCRRVASAVGKICLQIWGCHSPRADSLADACGLAFQLTNILRDLREDALRGRLYLPLEDLQNFDCREEEIVAGRLGDAGRRLLRFEIERTEGLFRAGAPLLQLLSPDARGVFAAMFNTYHTLLQKIGRHPEALLAKRIRLTRWEKLRIVARAMWAPDRLSPDVPPVPSEVAAT